MKPTNIARWLAVGLAAAVAGAFVYKKVLPWFSSEERGYREVRARIKTATDQRLVGVRDSARQFKPGVRAALIQCTESADGRSSVAAGLLDQYWRTSVKDPADARAIIVNASKSLDQMRGLLGSADLQAAFLYLCQPASPAVIDTWFTIFHPLVLLGKPEDQTVFANIFDTSGDSSATASVEAGKLANLMAAVVADAATRQ